MLFIKNKKGILRKSGAMNKGQMIQIIEDLLRQISAH